MLRKRGLDNVTIDGVRPLHPSQKLVGTAKTLRFVPGREDLFASHGGGYYVISPNDRAQNQAARLFTRWLVSQAGRQTAV